MISPSRHRWIYLAGLALVAIGLPFSNAFMSIGELVIAANFLLEGQFRTRLKKLKDTPSIWLFVGIFVMHAIGLFWSADLSNALEDLRVKLPMLLFPIVIPLSYKLKRSEFLWIAALFCASIIVTSFISTYNYAVHLHDPGFDFRKISVFTSHIRYSLMVCMSYLILLNFAWNEEKKRIYRFIYIGLAIWLSVFIFLLQSMTGVVLWFISSYIMLLYTLLYMGKTWNRTLAISCLIAAPLLVGAYLWKQVDDFYPDQYPDVSTFDQQTVNGEFYGHDPHNLMVENGNLIHSYVALKELRKEWGTRSAISFHDGKDAKGQFISATVIRFMSSKGLRKDSAGIASLTDEEIAAIENGIANVRYLTPNPIANRIYTIIWQFEKLKYVSNPEGHSVAQRLTYWKVGWEIFKENTWTGVGTGDVDLAFSNAYEELNTPLDEQFRKRTHNQYLTFAITFGAFGLVFFIFSLVLPFFKLPNAKSFLYLGFFIVAAGSMMNEDTLETQAGVTFYAFFNAFLLYALRDSGSSDKTIS